MDSNAHAVSRELPAIEDVLSPLKNFASDNLTQKEFATGSVGFYAGGKIAVKGEKYQVSLNIVKIGTKS